MVRRKRCVGRGGQGEARADAQVGGRGRGAQAEAEAAAREETQVDLEGYDVYDDGADLRHAGAKAQVKAEAEVDRSR